MSEVGAISGASAEQMALLEQTAREYGATTRYTASEAAQALKYMALAGWDTQQSIEGLGPILSLAASSGMDLAMASDIVTDYLSAFQLSVEDSAKFVDQMSYAMSHSNTSTEQLGEAYKNCASTAASMKFSVEDTTAALMTMANAGVKGGEAGTTLNTLMTRLATDTKGCATELEEYGVEVYDAEENLNSLSSILSQMILAWDGLTQKQQANLSKMIAGTNQYAGFQTLMSGMSKKAKEAGMSFEDYTKALEECDGTASEMAKTMSNNLTGDLKTLESALDELKLKIYDDAESPIRSVVQTITKDAVPAAEAIISHLDRIIPLLIGAASAMAAYRASMTISKIVKGIAESFGILDKVTKTLTISKTAETAAENLNTVSQTTNAAAATANSAAQTANAAATNSAAAAQTALNTAMKANIVGLVLAGIVALTTAIVSYSAISNTAAQNTNTLNDSQKNYLQTLENTKSRTKENIDKSEEDIKVLNTLKTRYDELREEVKLSTDEKKEFANISQNLANTLGVPLEYLKDTSGAYKDLTKDIDDYISKLQEKVKFEASEENLKAAYGAYNSAAKAIQEYSSQVEEAQKKYDEAKAKLQEYSDYVKNADSIRNSQERLQATTSEEYKAYKKDEKAANDLYDALLRVKNARSDAQIAAIRAAEDVKEYSLAIGSSAQSAEQGFENLINQLTIQKQEDAKSTESGASAYDSYTKAIQEAETTLESMNETEESSADKLTKQNKALLENQIAVKKAREELKQLIQERDSAKPSETSADWYLEQGKLIEDATDKLAELLTAQTELRENISETKKEIKSAGQETEITLETVVNSAENLAKIQKEIDTNGQLSLNTLNSIVKKYPELNSLVNDYINGKKSEADIINALQKAYQNDVDNYNKASKEKLIALDNTNSAISESHRQLINTLKEFYDADLDNFTNLQSAKADIFEKFKLSQAGQKINEYALRIRNGEYYALDWNSLDSDAQNTIQSILSEIGWSYADYQEYVRSGFKNITQQGNSDFGKIIEDAVNAYNSNNPSVNPDDIFRFVSDTSSGSGSSKSGDNPDAFHFWGGGVDVTGSSYAQAYLKWISRMKNLGKLTTEDEIYNLELLLKYEKNTADERYEIEYNLKQAREKLSQEEEKKTQEYQQSLQKKLDLANAAYERLINNRIDLYHQQSDAAKTAADKEIAYIDKVMSKRKEEQADAKRQSEIDKINAQLKYKHLDEISRLELERKRDSLLEEQAEINYERQMNLRKEDISARLEAVQAKNNQAIESLQQAQTWAANYFAAQAGTQTTQQIVNNNNQKQNITLVQNALSDQQIMDRLEKWLFQ